MRGRQGFQQDRCFCEKEGETESLRFEKASINALNAFMWAFLWKNCALCEFKTQAHHISLVGWFLPRAVWYILGRPLALGSGEALFRSFPILSGTKHFTCSWSGFLFSPLSCFSPLLVSVPPDFPPAPLLFNWLKSIDSLNLGLHWVPSPALETGAASPHGNFF